MRPSGSDGDAGLPVAMHPFGRGKSALAEAMRPPSSFRSCRKELRPQARVVGQPPHERRHLGRRQTGRTRMGYAASVSGKAANGCAAPGPKEKNATAGRSAQSAYLRPPAGDGWPFRVDVLIKRDTLGESLGPGRARIPFPPSFRWRWSGSLLGFPLVLPWR